MTSPLVSVAIATYNGAQYLREQLNTIYAQTWQNLEVVVSDDASTDGTSTILLEYAASRGLRHSVNPRRLGLVQNFARAISLCHGEFIALADQDDLWKPQKIEALVDNIGGFTLIYCNSQEVLTSEGFHEIDTTYQRIADFARAFGTGSPTRHLLAENWIVSHTLMFRRELLRHALPIPPHQPYHDGWLALVASKLGGIKYLDERLQTYRRHPGSLTFVDAAERPHRRTPLAILDGTFGVAWRARCAAEMARLKDALELPLLDAEDRAFLNELLTYYGAGLRGGHGWLAFRAGWKIAPFVATLHGSWMRWKFPLRGFIGSS
ncbi:MAG TPA: glycosyltransferase [Thermoanaerobaculia bacterium]|nr:glycosyltransferase [Thermoanaerobaculia bacterium]